MYTATGFPVFIRGFRLSLSVEGLRPRTAQNYVYTAAVAGELAQAAHQRHSPAGAMKV